MRNLTEIYWRIQVDKPASALAWMPNKICKPKIKKVSTENNDVRPNLYIYVLMMGCIIILDQLYMMLSYPERYLSWRYLLDILAINSDRSMSRIAV